MANNNVCLNIGDVDYYLTTDDDPKYLKNLGNEVDEIIRTTRRAHKRLSMTQAAVLCALTFADEKKKTEQKIDHLRAEIQAYLEDAEKAKTDAEISRREVERLNKEVSNLKKINEKLKKS